jgi:C4-type Zn-finger protein
MAKVVNIHTGEEVVVEKAPKMECTICEGLFDLEEEGGTTGYFGILMVAFCPFCLSSMVDLVTKLFNEPFKEKD